MRSKDVGGHAYFKYAGLGIEFTCVVCLFIYFGYAADQHWNSDPWGILIGGAIGLTGGIYLLVKEGLKAMNELDGNQPSAPGDRTRQEHSD